MRKINTIFAVVILALASLSFTNVLNTATVYTVNTKGSKVEFIGNKKSGYHPGYFPIKSGTVNVVDGKITGGKFTIDIAGVKVTDESGAGLEGTLKSKDFFNSFLFGTAEFEITSVNYKDEGNAEIAGNLTIKGIKSEIKFNAAVREVNDKALFAQGFFSLDRTKIGVPGFENMISKDVQIAVHLFADK